MPVIVLTGDLDPSLKRRALKLGAKMVLRKPTPAGRVAGAAKRLALG